MQSGSLVLTYQDANNLEQTLTFTPSGGGMGMADGVLSSATFDTGTQMLTLTLSTGTSLPAVDLSEFITATELGNQIATGINARLASSAPEDVVSGSGSVGSSTDVARADHVHGGGGGGLSSVTTDTTLTGDGTSGDALSVANPPATWAYASGATGTAPSARLPGFTVHRESTSQTYDPTNGVIAFTVTGTDLSDGDLIVFDAPSNLGSDSSVQLSVNVNNTGNRNLIDREENRINETHLIASAWYIIQRDSASYSILTSLEDVAPWAQAVGGTGTAPVARLGTGSPSSTTFLRGDGSWQPPSGLTQSQGDSRYAQLGSANTFTTGPQNIDYDGFGLQVDGRAYTGGDPIFAVRTGPTGNRKAFSAAKGNDAQPWFAIEYNIGGADKPGFGISQGGTSIEDVILYRDAQNVFRTNDAFHVGSLRVDAAGRASSRTQLGLGTAATQGANRLLPAGGAAGQVLGKSSATDYDVGWVANAGTGATTFLGLTDTPNTFGTAGQVATVNAGADGLVFSNAGSGDITAITTPTGSGIGLTGCATGDCAIALDIPGMDSIGLNSLTSGDQIILEDGGNERRTTLGNVANFTFGRIVNLTDLGALANGDHFVVNDASEGADDPRDVSAALVSNYIGNRLAGDNLTYNTTTNQLDATGGAGGDQIELIDSLNDVSYTQADTADLSSRFGSGATVYTADLDTEGTADAEINDLIVFQWRDNPAAVPATRALGIRINDTGTTLPIRIIDPITNSLTNKTRADLTRYEFLFLSRQDGVFIQMSSLQLSEAMARLVPAGGTAGQVLTKDTATDFDMSWTTISGGGTGDITAVTTSATSGLSGGTNSGAAALTTDWGQLTAFDSSSEDSAAADDLINVYVDDHGGQQSMSISTFASEYSLGGAGASTFLGLNDTPNAYTASYLVAANAAADALEQVPVPTNHNTIPHVGRIPAVTPTSPDLIFLTHDEIDGNREDATFTIGRDAGNSCGYSDGSIYSPAFGAISEPSPVTTIFGIWNATDSNCDIDLVYSQNEGWLDDQAMIVGTISGTAFSCSLGVRRHLSGQSVKRITSCTALEDLALGDITINFLTSDTTPQPYWTDGETTHPAGLYEKVGTPPAYHDIRPIEESHRRGMGSFACGDSEAPDDGGQVCIDDEGRASFSTDAVALTTVEPEITAMTEFMSDYWQESSNNIIGFNNTGENGEFKWYTAGDIFFQIQGTRAQGSITVSGTDGTVIPEGTIFDRDGVSTTLIRTLADATIGAGGTVTITVEAVSPGLTGNNIPPTATFTLEDPITGVNDSAIIQDGIHGRNRLRPGGGILGDDLDLHRHDRRRRQRHGSGPARVPSGQLRVPRGVQPDAGRRGGPRRLHGGHRPLLLPDPRRGGPHPGDHGIHGRRDHHRSLPRVAGPGGHDRGRSQRVRAEQQRGPDRRS